MVGFFSLYITLYNMEPLGPIYIGPYGQKGPQKVRILINLIDFVVHKRKIEQVLN